MEKISCGGFWLGSNLSLDGQTLSVGSDNMSLSDAGLEVSSGVVGDTISFGCVEDEESNLVNGIRGTGDIYIYGGSGESVFVYNDTEISGDLTVDGQIIGNKEIILQSSTASSTKQFKITVNDSGTITATEI